MLKWLKRFERTHDKLKIDNEDRQNIFMNRM